MSTKWVKTCNALSVVFYILYTVEKYTIDLYVTNIF